jgi:hypothetical protein
MKSSQLAVFMLPAVGALALACSSDSGSHGTNSSQHPSSSSCDEETRAPPYSAGMTFEGSEGVTIALTDSAPAPPILGNNTWTLDVTDASGAPLADATITATQFMVDHGHPGSRTIYVTSLGEGSYKAAPVNFNMSGYWETTFTVKTAALEDTIVVKTCIP